MIQYVTLELQNFFRTARALLPRNVLPRKADMCGATSEGSEADIACPTLRTGRCSAAPCFFLAIIIFEARAISGRRLRQGFSQSNSDQNSQRRANRHAVCQESQNSLHTPLVALRE